jgi:hypothetical protein
LSVRLYRDCKGEKESGGQPKKAQPGDPSNAAERGPSGVSRRDTQRHKKNRAYNRHQHPHVSILRVTSRAKNGEQYRQQDTYGYPQA